MLLNLKNAAAIANARLKTLIKTIIKVESIFRKLALSLYFIHTDDKIHVSDLLTDKIHINVKHD